MAKKNAADLDLGSVISLLKLEPLAGEGGYFRRTWVSAAIRADGRACGSAIYYLLSAEAQGFSALHTLDEDEVYHFYAGSPAELQLIHADGRATRVLLGNDLAAGQVPQALVPAGTIQGSRVAGAGAWSLLGTTMAPAFTSGGFTLCDPADLQSRFPKLRTIIKDLTR